MDKTEQEQAGKVETGLGGRDVSFDFKPGTVLTVMDGGSFRMSVKDGMLEDFTMIRCHMKLPTPPKE